MKYKTLRSLGDLKQKMIDYQESGDVENMIQAID